MITKIRQTVRTGLAAFAAPVVKAVNTPFGSRRPALCALLLGLTALWAIPRGVAVPPTPLYVAEVDSGRVGTYGATTGAVLNASFITGLNAPFALAVSGHTLFVANDGSGTVGAYNAATGAVLNASFITGLNAPFALAVSGHTLFVASFGNGTVGAYNAATGAVLNASFITGLSFPVGLAVSGNTLFVANYNTGTVGAYKAPQKHSCHPGPSSAERDGAAHEG
jgi:6-phosphogluconolactonase (cycloisomerase 2 family)